MSIKANDVKSIVIPFDMFESAAARFEENVQAIIKKRPKQLSLNCEWVESVNRDHIVMLLNTINNCIKAGIKIFIVSAPPMLVRLLRELGFAKFIKVDDNSFNNGQDTAIDPIPSFLIRLFCDEFQANTGSLLLSLAKFEQYLVSANLPDVLRLELYLVFYEIAENILVHAGLDKNSKISICAFINDNKFVIRFIDHGVEFDSSSLRAEINPETGVADGRYRGIGLLLVHKISTSISYTRSEQGANILIIEKEWRD